MCCRATRRCSACSPSPRQVRVKLAGGEQLAYDVTGGFLSVGADGVTVLAESATPATPPAASLTPPMQILEVIGIGIVARAGRGPVRVFVRRAAADAAAAARSGCSVRVTTVVPGRGWSAGLRPVRRRRAALPPDVQLRASGPSGCSPAAGWSWSAGGSPRARSGSPCPGHWVILRCTSQHARSRSRWPSPR